MSAPAIRPLSDDLQKKAIEVLNEDPDRLPADLEALKTWIHQQPHLRARTDDQFLVAFLRGCKYSLEKAKSKIDKFYSLRTKYPDVFVSGCDVDEARILEILRLGVFTFLPTPLNDNGPRIAVMRMGNYSPDKYSMLDIMLAGQLMQEIALNEDDYAIVNGVVQIMDFANTTTSHLYQMTPSLMKKMSVFSEEALPVRPQAIHFINVPAAFDTVFNVLKPLMSQKQQSRMHVHGNKMEKLQEQIPKKYLPKEYGGENGSMDEEIKNWEKRIIAYREYFKENGKFGTDESLRPGKPIDYDSMFGLEGSFRKLNVD